MSTETETARELEVECSGKQLENDMKYAGEIVVRGDLGEFKFGFETLSPERDDFILVFSYRDEEYARITGDAKAILQAMDEGKRVIVATMIQLVMRVVDNLSSGGLPQVRRRVEELVGDFAKVSASTSFTAKIQAKDRHQNLLIRLELRRLGSSKA